MKTKKGAKSKTPIEFQLIAQARREIASLKGRTDRKSRARLKALRFLRDTINQIFYNRHRRMMRAIINCIFDSI